MTSSVHRFIGGLDPGRSLRRTGMLMLLAGSGLLPCTVHAQQAAAEPAKFDRKKFSHSTDINNKWMPSKPGMRWTYSGTSVEDDGKVVRHRLEVTITDLVKPIGGVQTVVSYDLDYSDNELVEAELSFFAQDDDGNVWRFGEYPEEYEDGKLIKSPAWIHGFENARAGIMMEASPRLGTRSYSQGWGPAVGWKDRAVTFQIGQKVAVKAGSYEDALVIKETAVGEEDAAQLKYYAPNLGNVRVAWTGDRRLTQETLELTKFEQVDEKTLAEVRAKALALEKSAYEHGAKAYNRTRPAAPISVPK